MIHTVGNTQVHGLPSAIHTIGRIPPVELSRPIRDLDGRSLARSGHLCLQTVLR
jgi:hypothetical protein